jgi:hypothetical protein
MDTPRLFFKPKTRAALNRLRSSGRWVREIQVKRAGTYRPWAELLKRTFGVDVLACPKCHGRTKLLAMVTEPASFARYLVGIGEPVDVPARSPNRGPPYCKSTVLRRRAFGDAA